MDTMSGLKIQLDSEFTDTSMDRLYDDPVLTEGSLLMVDLAHPASPAAAGVPATSTTVPNVAWKEAKRTIGSGSESTLAPVWQLGASWASPSVGVVERSGKGGLHVILAASALRGTNKGCGIRPPQPVVDWIVANPTHDYYVSIWMKITRFGNESEHTVGYSANATPNALSAVLASIGGSPGGCYPTGAARIGFRRTRDKWRPADDAAVTAPFADAIMANIAVDSYTGTPNTSGSTAQSTMMAFGAGAFGPFNGGAGGMMSSKLLWRSYMEDLTVSGRTYAQVDALDFAEYTKQCLTSGGRYYGDTYTDPATVT